MRFALAPVSVAALLLFAACSAGDDETSAPTTTPTTSPAATETVTATVMEQAPAATPEVTPAPVPGASPRGIGYDDVPTVVAPGLFEEPQVQAPDAVRQLSEPPPSPFPPADFDTTWLYDTLTGEAFDLGTGGVGAFNPSSTLMGWADGAEQLWLLDLRTMERRTLGPARFVRFMDDDTVGVALPGGNVTEFVDVTTGDRSPGRGVFRGPDPVVRMDGGRELRLISRETAPFDGRHWRHELKAAGSDERVFVVEAWLARPAGPGELAVATPPGGETANIFIVEIASGDARFVATATGLDVLFVLDSSAGFVVWTDDVCSPDGRTYVYDRAARRLTELDARLFPTLTGDGRLVDGGFGGTRILDLTTFEWSVVLPDGPIDASWSPDYRYASRGATGGHGGHCGA